MYKNLKEWESIYYILYYRQTTRPLGLLFWIFWVYEHFPVCYHVMLQINTDNYVYTLSNNLVLVKKTTFGLH